MILSLIFLGSFYIHDIPAILISTLEDKFQVEDTEYNALYSIYVFPNLIAPILGGIFIDKVGARIGVVVFTTIICISQAV